jgi:hypothetical protein
MALAALPLVEAMPQAVRQGKEVKPRVSHRPRGFRMGKEYPGISSPKPQHANGTDSKKFWQEFALIIQRLE